MWPVLHTSLYTHDGQPKVLPLPLNCDKQFIKVPVVPQTALSSFEPPSIIRTKLLTPLTNGVMRDGDTTFGHQLLDLPEAETESMVLPVRMTDDFGWKAMASVAGGVGFHHARLPQLG